MEYQTIFDVTTAGYRNWDFSAFGIPFVAIGALLVTKRRSLPGWWGDRPRASSAFAYFFLVFSLLWTLIAFVSTYSDYSSLAQAVKSNSATVTEGIVHDFKPMPVTGHSMERFCVSDRCFSYSDFNVTAGFNNTSSHGGPIREGLVVRVTHVRGSIAKLEVAK
jgi:hypothetical protein